MAQSPPAPACSSFHLAPCIHFKEFNILSFDSSRCHLVPGADKQALKNRQKKPTQSEDDFVLKKTLFSTSFIVLLNIFVHRFLFLKLVPSNGSVTQVFLVRAVSEERAGWLGCGCEE